ncbi:hypothetical protein K402DRAFT_426790 [Aulographum hederae CBS 113979]|uniref:MFS general substrate transporter n=1 Tax=Aulographum hederae CBS 113979 TaxID=1176131 RepID=A0A6G1H6Z6_9PEZI|nr:hypothetical protein K402DRAFT_426790 [Aulographum hederae CBS 113979]
MELAQKDTEEVYGKMPDEEMRRRSAVPQIDNSSASIFVTQKDDSENDLGKEATDTSTLPNRPSLSYSPGIPGQSQPGMNSQQSEERESDLLRPNETTSTFLDVRTTYFSKDHPEPPHGHVGGTTRNSRNSVRGPAQTGELFIHRADIPRLLAISACWMLWDVAYYGLSLTSPRMISSISESRPPPPDGEDIPPWNSDSSDPGASILTALKTDAVRAMLLVGIPSILGFVAILLGINYVRRTRWLTWSLGLLTLLSALMGATYDHSYEKGRHVLIMIFFVLCEFLGHLDCTQGPNTITFLLPAEIFPTRCRCTCFGIAAAAGKVGSIIIQIVVSYAGVNSPNARPGPTANMLGSFAPLMFVGAAISRYWLWEPDAQMPRVKGQVSDVERQRIQTFPDLKKWIDKWKLHNRSLEEVARWRETGS